MSTYCIDLQMTYQTLFVRLSKQQRSPIVTLKLNWQ